MRVSYGNTLCVALEQPRSDACCHVHVLLSMMSVTLVECKITVKNETYSMQASHKS